AFFGQSHFQGIERLAGLNRRDLQFLVHFFFADGNVFFSGNAVEKDVGFHFGQRTVTLCGAQPRKIQFAHLLGLHALRRERAQSAFQTRVNLVLHQRFRNRERELLTQRRKQPIPGFRLDTAALAVLHVLADALLQVGVVLVVPELLG